MSIMNVQLSVSVAFRQSAILFSYFTNVVYLIINKCKLCLINNLKFRRCCGKITEDHISVRDFLAHLLIASPLSSIQPLFFLRFTQPSPNSQLPPPSPPSLGFVPICSLIHFIFLLTQDKSS